MRRLLLGFGCVALAVVLVGASISPAPTPPGPVTISTVGHVSSVVHTSAVRASVPGPLWCHSRASFNMTASGIVAHAGTATTRLYICGIVLAGKGPGTSVAVVEGTAAACGSGTVGIIGATTHTSGIALSYHTFSIMTTEPWALTAAGSQICILTSQVSTPVTGTIYYGAY